MSSPSASYSETSSTNTSSSGDKSVEQGEPSKVPEPKTTVLEPKWVPWAPSCSVPIAVVAPRQVVPMLQVGPVQRQSTVTMTQH